MTDKPSAAHSILAPLPPPTSELWDLTRCGRAPVHFSPSLGGPFPDEGCIPLALLLLLLLLLMKATFH